MLRSTYQAPAPPNAPAPLPEGWTEHKAPTGHTYYYHAATKKSTYKRPTDGANAAAPEAPPTAPPNPSASFMQYQAVGNAPLNTAHVPSNQHQGHQSFGGRGGYHPGGRGGHEQRGPRPQPTDKPKSKHAIPGCEPWFLVYTKYGRRFAFNEEKNQSYWRIPEKLKEGILALDQLRIKEKASSLEIEKKAVSSQDGPKIEASKVETVAQAHTEDYDSSEYEEVEVTDDEDEENPAKRQRTEEPQEDGPVEFGEDDIAFQLAAMGGADEDIEEEYWDEEGENYELSEEDAAGLFRDLLDDTGINPYSPWDKIIEDGKLIDDPRYTALTTMKARKEIWEEWSKNKIRLLREKRAREEKKDPRIPYLSFLQKHATPKLYWPEFKRKFKKEQEMRSTSLADKDREKWYREHISRLKLPQSTLKSDLSTLLKSQPLSQLNNATLISDLPPAILSDIKYISLDPAVRDPLIEGYISTLPPPPETIPDEETEEALKERKERERRQKALVERERKVAEEKRRQRKNLAYSKGLLRDEEEELRQAMNVSKKGLMGHLVNENDGADAK